MKHYIFIQCDMKWPTSFIQEKDVRDRSWLPLTTRKNTLIKTQLVPLRTQRMDFQEAHRFPCSLLKSLSRKLALLCSLMIRLTSWSWMGLCVNRLSRCPLGDKALPCAVPYAVGQQDAI